MTQIALFVIAAFALGLSACTNPYDPVQRGLGAAHCWASLSYSRRKLGSLSAFR